MYSPFGKEKVVVLYLGARKFPRATVLCLIRTWLLLARRMGLASIKSLLSYINIFKAKCIIKQRFHINKDIMLIA